MTRIAVALALIALATPVAAQASSRPPYELGIAQVRFRIVTIARAERYIIKHNGFVVRTFENVHVLCGYHGHQGKVLKRIMCYSSFDVVWVAGPHDGQRGYCSGHAPYHAIGILVYRAGRVTWNRCIGGVAA